MTVAVIVVREGRLPVGAPEVVAEAGGRVVVVGGDAEAALRSLSGVTDGRFAETGPGFQPAALAAALGDVVVDDVLVLLPASPDGRDLAPRLAAATGRPLVARALTAAVDDAGSGVRASVARIDDQVLIPVEV
ncbi:MAG TPA: hypothetical protein VII96_09975, partial [Acidimicrobiales bacterium]